MVRAAVLGASGGIGQPLSLLLKLNPHITELRLYDIVNVRGVGADLSHINTGAKLTAHQGPEELENALDGCELVVIPAGIPRKPGMTRDDLFKINAGIVKDLASKIAKKCPKAFVLIISNPVNSTVPIVAEVLKKAGVFDPRRLFGVTTLDSVRASAFVSQTKGGSSISPVEVRMPIVGGHSGVTIVPLISQTNPRVELSKEETEQLTKRIQFGGDEVVKAKDGAGSATLSMAHAGARFANSIIEASQTGKKIVEAAYVSVEADKENSQKLKELIGDCSFFAFDVELSKNGVEKIIPFNKPNEYEQTLIKEAVNELSGSIKKGTEFVNKL